MLIFENLFYSNYIEQTIFIYTCTYKQKRTIKYELHDTIIFLLKHIFKVTESTR